MINKAIQEKIERLQRGETFWTSESGNSMTPILYSNQKTKLEPVKDWHDLKKKMMLYFVRFIVVVLLIKYMQLIIIKEY